MSQVDAARRDSAQKGADLMRLREEHDALRQTTGALAAQQQQRIDALTCELGTTQVDIARLREQLAAAAKRDEELGPIVRDYGILRRQNEDLARRLALLGTGFLARLRAQPPAIRSATLDDLLTSQLPLLPVHRDIAPLLLNVASHDLSLESWELQVDGLSDTVAALTVPFRFAFTVTRAPTPTGSTKQRRFLGMAVLSVDDAGLVTVQQIQAQFEDPRT